MRKFIVVNLSEPDVNLMRSSLSVGYEFGVDVMFSFFISEDYELKLDEFSKLNQYYTEKVTKILKSRYPEFSIKVISNTSVFKESYLPKDLLNINQSKLHKLLKDKDIIIYSVSNLDDLYKLTKSFEKLKLYN